MFVNQGSLVQTGLAAKGIFGHDESVLAPVVTFPKARHPNGRRGIEGQESRAGRDPGLLEGFAPGCLER